MSPSTISPNPVVRSNCNYKNIAHSLKRNASAIQRNSNMNSDKILNGLHQTFTPVKGFFASKIRLVLLMTVMGICALSMSAISIASSSNKHEKQSSNQEVEVNNFGKVTDFYYRGAQPKEDEYGQLASIGIKTIIDLRNDPKEQAKTIAERAGLKYINLPLSDKNYPAADTADKFLALINDKNNLPVYVHCIGGRHRTGAMTAVFRMKVQGWNIEKAYDEMKDYDFYTRWGHKAIKEYVFDYYRELLVSRKEEQKNAPSSFGGENR
jgi:protein tyrosine/serine phosphatase